MLGRSLSHNQTFTVPCTTIHGLGAIFLSLIGDPCGHRYEVGEKGRDVAFDDDVIANNDVLVENLRRVKLSNNCGRKRFVNACPGNFDVCVPTSRLKSDIISMGKSGVKGRSKRSRIQSTLRRHRDSPAQKHRHARSGCFCVRLIN